MAALTYRHETRGHIDRSRPISFSFNGQPCLGFVGDTLASALLANDIQIIGRSLKFNRPRGINGASWEDTSSYVRLEEGESGRIVLASAIDLYAGLSATSMATWPPPKFLDRLRNKEPARPDISTAKHQITHEGYNSRAIIEHCDVLVIGSGPAGLMAATAAAQAGQRVIVTEMDTEMGGSLLWCTSPIGNKTSPEWLAQTLADLRSNKDVGLHTRSQAVGMDELGRTIALTTLADQDGASSGRRFLVRKINAPQIVMATGSDERLLAFPGNDTPGVMRASALAAYASRYGIACPKAPIVVMTNNDDGHAQACQLSDLGFNVTTIVDNRHDIMSHVVGPVCDRGINLIGGHVITDIEGSDHVEGVVLRQFNNDELSSGKTTLDCAFIAVSGGWNPRQEFLESVGGSLRYDEHSNGLAADDKGPVAQLAGSILGDTTLLHALQSGLASGLACATENGASPLPSLTLPALPPSTPDKHPKPFWKVPQSGIVSRPRQWADLRSETTTTILERALGKGAELPEDSYLGALEDLQMAGAATGISMDMVMTRIDPDIAPPRRQLPTHLWQVQQGAAFRLAHQWLRPALYPQEGINNEEAISEEMMAARQAVTLHDLSAVGTLEVTGNGAREFLDRVYTANIGDLSVGKSCYGMMLDEAGMIVNHGVVACLRENHFMVNTSPGAGDTVQQWMQGWHDSDMSHLAVHITQVSHQWACLLLTGPRARQVLLELDRDMDISTAAMPFLGIQTGTLGGMKVCLIRTGYTGDVTFEIHLEANQALSMWQSLMAAGTPFGIRAMGEDALVRLGAEKGHLDMATITEQSLSPTDISTTGNFAAKEANFIGKKALERPTQNTANRLQLVALRGDGEQTTVPQDSVITHSADDNQVHTSRGHILTSFFSQTLNQIVTHALIENGHKRIGDIVHVSTNTGPLPMRISRPTIFDPNGRKRHG
jgi:sarcosine oxidase, subunit alpha